MPILETTGPDGSDPVFLELLPKAGLNMTKSNIILTYLKKIKSKSLSRFGNRVLVRVNHFVLNTKINAIRVIYRFIC